MGGRTQKGGAILDFYLPGFNLSIQIQGEYWHYGSSGQMAQAQLQRIELEGRGITMIYIDESDILRNPIWYVKQALAGRDFSRMAGR